MRAFRVVYAFLALNFILPTLSYAVTPAVAMAAFGQLNAILGGGELPLEQSVFWWVLGVGNVGTLGFCCLLVLSDLKRWHPAVVPLVFLKGIDAVMWGVAAAMYGEPAYLAAFLLDIGTCWALWWFPRRALLSL
jgi:hypothetical protein